MKSKLSGLYARMLSPGGKEVILKSVALAMPIFGMSCFKLPKTTCANITSVMSAFWWNASTDKRKTHWVSWNKLCLPKESGGMGFKNLEVMNQALLAKQAWKLYNEKESLLARFIKSRYYNHSEFLDAELGVRPSYGWRSILWGRELLNTGLKQMIGNGESTRVWTTCWLDDGRKRAPFMKNTLVDLELMVSDLIDPVSKTWCLETLEDLFFPPDIEMIRKIIPVTELEDYKCWEHNRSGAYTVKSGYWLGSQKINPEIKHEAEALPSVNPIREKIWKLNIPSKIQIFLWKIVSGAMPVAEKIAARGMKVDTQCQSCGAESESENHTIFTCPVARQMWALSDIPLPDTGFDSNSIFQNMFYMLDLAANRRVTVEMRNLFPWLIWRIWKNRNALIFEGVRYCPRQSVEKSNADMLSWAQAHLLDVNEEQVMKTVAKSKTQCWIPPEEGWIKCDIGTAWDKKNHYAGVSWVTRNHRGNVLMHSRNSYVNVHSALEASRLSWTWAFEGMSSLGVGRVVFVSDARDLVGAVNKPPDWPSFRWFSSLILRLTRNLAYWKVEFGSKEQILGAVTIAESVIIQNRPQSYVSLGAPFWLYHLFAKDRRSLDRF